MRAFHIPIAIIGAGASGLAAAIAAARVRPASVMLLEKETRVGRKLLATGNGRCNLMNMHVSKKRFHGSGAHAALSLLERTTPHALLAFFASIGLRCREEAEGRVYPFSGQASAVLDALRLACDQLHVQTRTEAWIRQVKQTADGFALTLASGEIVRADRVIIAGGGCASPALGSDGSAFSLLQAMGHSITSPMPAIAPLKLPLDRIRGAKGVRIAASLSLLCENALLQREEGEALFTDYGISGVAAMQLARRVNSALQEGRAPMLQISFMDKGCAQDEMAQRAGLFAGLPAETLFTGLLHKQLGACLLRAANIAPGTLISPQVAMKIAPLLSAWTLPVQGTLPFANAQVTAGGADAGEFDPETLASYLVPGLYACGEALDVDGDCGGYNLMWAWASGLAAGEAAAVSLQST